MKLMNMKISVRLGPGFGVVMLLMVILIVVGLVRLSSIADIEDKILTKEWVEYDAVQTIDATTRDNARETMGLFITGDTGKVARIYRVIDANKKTIDQAFGTLDKLAYSPEGKALLAQIQASRMAYVASFSKVARLLAAGSRDEAVTTMSNETLPALDLLQERITVLVRVGKKLEDAGGAESRQNIGSARNLMIGLGLAAISIGIGSAYAITRSITRPLQDAVQVARTVASGDLTSHIGAQTTDETGQLLQSFNDMNESLKEIVGQVRTGTDAIATATSQIASGNRDLFSRTEEARLIGGAFVPFVNIWTGRLLQEFCLNMCDCDLTGTMCPSTIKSQ
jgi:methyl-accepting chemotaxis protein